MKILHVTIIACAISAGWNSSFADANDSSDYLLPFQAGTEYLVYQANNGPYGHTDHVAFAFDFGLETGTLVTAARSGIVVKSNDEFADDNGTPGEENTIVVRHADGTFARYYHLRHRGSFVSVDQRVSAGQPIGYSGNTGASAGPHLHFDVTKGCFDWGCETVELRFENVCDDQREGVPQTGDEVRACPEP